VFIGFIGALPLIGGNPPVFACCGAGAAVCPGNGAGNATCADAGTDPNEASAQAETTANVQRGKQDEITAFLQQRLLASLTLGLLLRLRIALNNPPNQAIARRLGAFRARLSQSGGFSHPVPCSKTPAV
jgi:hypothetical protein